MRGKENKRNGKRDRFRPLGTKSVGLSCNQTLEL